MSQHFVATTQSVDLRALNMMNRWVSMWQRCYDPSSNSYEYYGARNIQVCPEWFDFKCFLDFWGYPPFEGATIGRIDNDGNYDPSNCEWQTQQQQNNNTRRSRLITWNGKTQSIRDWAQEYNIGTRRLSERLRRGWDMQKALTTYCPKGFAKEREERQSEYARLWKINGHLYRARSKWRRGHRLSLPLQDLIAVEGVEPTRDDQLRKSKAQSSKGYNRVSVDQVQQVLDFKAAGATIRKIADFTGIPKSTVHYILSTRDNS